MAGRSATMPAAGTLGEQPIFRRLSSVSQQRQRERFRWYSAYLVMLFVAVVLTALAIEIPGPFAIAFAALVITGIAWLVRPLVGMHLTLFFTLFGDFVTIPWFPFTKNFSSHESALFISDELTVSPLLVVIAVAIVSVLIRHFALREHKLVLGPMFGPLAALTGFVAFGLLYGLGRGGNLRVAIYESTGLLVLPIVYLLVSNTCHSRRDYRGLLWTALFAVVGQSIMSFFYYLGLSATEKEDLEALGEHGSAVTMNAFFAVLIIAFLFTGAARSRRVVLLLCAVPVSFVYLVSQRRSAFVGLAAALIAMSMMLFWRQRKRFWKIIPVIGILAIGYLGAFWNSTGQLAFPAQAAKSVISPESLSEADRGSDLYRQIENYDLNITIRSSRVLGLGFGHEFLRPIALPDISFFEFYRYMPHNSILWIWIQTGFLGFVSLFYTFGRAIALGARKARGIVDHNDFALVLSCSLFVLMYALYAYVDIAWYARDTMFLGFCFAVCANFPARVAGADGAEASVASAADLQPGVSSTVPAAR